jgi:hypothetical protein
VDREIPIFTQERFYVERHLMTPEQQEQDAAAKRAWDEITGGLV